MKWICQHCDYKNPMDLPHCAQCGNMRGANVKTVDSSNFLLRKISTLGTFGWILIVLLGVAAVILTPILFIAAISHWEGFAGLLLLIGGYFGARSAVRSQLGPPAKAVFIVFFSIMGMSLDQTGNYLYNFPFRYLCPDSTTMKRSVLISHPLPGRTDTAQAFSCLDPGGKEISRIQLPATLGIRFTEYLLIAGMLLFVQERLSTRKRFRNED
ncbi:hypothetical protein [Leptospira adleri]|uniref:RanBP2-type domain-containing protein n=1 Tax=Leptospira adleri TaxID=2023186 RepID=A0A2M9YQW1_9LEPT|nr:hypothetical protein [Leptospira adleri]PJZ53909.1 hypothetical protein CH380_07855 [Leptospira adleri]PJZ59527.1 hypothetical protein CH376_23230 [Leptospira adleri]